MPALAEIRESYGAALKSVKQLRDQWHTARDAKKPQAELDAIKASLAEARTKLDTAKSQFDAETEVDELDNYIAEAERAAKLSGKRGKNKPGRDDFDPDLGGQRDTKDLPTQEDQQIALQAWAMRGTDIEPSKRHREAVAKCKRAGVRYGKTLAFPIARTHHFRKLQQLFRSVHPSLIGSPQFEERAMSSIVGGDGGFGVSQGYLRQLEINMLSYSGVLQVCDVMRTARGDRIPWPTSNDTTNEGSQIGQSKSLGLGGGTNPKLTPIYFDAHKIHSEPISVPFELLEDWDAAPALEDYIQNAQSERLGRHRNRKYTLGLGNGEPMGMMTAATLGRTTDSPTEFIGDDFIRLIRSVDPSYRNGASFLLHDSIMLEVELLKDEQGQYIHTPGLTAGARDIIRGYPVSINQHMDSAPAASNKVAAFGQMTKFKVREVGQVRLKRLDELGADNDEIWFDALMRHDSNLIDAGTAPIKYLQMAAA